jgi:hypothetical protein
MERTRGPLVVSGVVHQSGVLGSRSRVEEDWALTFALQPWRVVGGPLHLGRLPIRWWITQSEARVIARRLEAYFVVTLRVSALDEGRGAEVVGFHQLRRPDLELIRWAKALREHAARERHVGIGAAERTGPPASLLEQTARAARAMRQVVVAHM